MNPAGYGWNPSCHVGFNAERPRKEVCMSFALYIVGFLVLIIGLAWGAHLAHVPQQWIGVGVVVLVGLGIVTAVTHTRHRDSN